MSELLLRTRVSGPGTVKCEVPRPGDGACRPLGTGEADGRAYYAFAVYTPPDGFGPGPGGTREVSVRFGFTPRNGPPRELSHTVQLGRPPVVLVRGTFSSIEAWREGQTVSWIEVTKSSMQVALEAAGFEVFLVDYKPTNNSRYVT